MQENQKKLGPIYKITWYIWFEAVMFWVVVTSNPQNDVFFSYLIFNDFLKKINSNLITWPNT
jgi:hypothetical protein